MQNEHLSYEETDRRFELTRGRARAWEKIYLAEGPEGFQIERRGLGNKGKKRKPSPMAVSQSIMEELQWLRAENEYLKNLRALVLESERHQHKKRR